MGPNYLKEFYEKHCDEDARLGSRHGAVEFLTTMRYIEKYLKPGDRVIEIGAGTGRYSHALARKGYAVDAVELLGHNIDVFRRNTLNTTSASVSGPTWWARPTTIWTYFKNIEPVHPRPVPGVRA